jgi:hypothetical protein
MTEQEPLIEQLQNELTRLDVREGQVSMDRQFEPSVGKLVFLKIGEADWHLVPGTLLPLLRGLPDHVGGDAVKKAIESHADMVWHGPSPEGSRDTSP